MPTAKEHVSIDTEKAILGAILLDNSAFQQCDLDASDFYLDSHRILFDTIKEMLAGNYPVDLVTLAQWMMDRGQLERIGGAVYVASLTDGLPKVANIRHYVEIVKEKAAQRRRIQTGEAIIQTAEQGVSAAEFAATVRAMVPGPESGNGKGKNLPEKIYPTMPDAAWCETSRVYYDALKNSTSASEAYHLAVFIAAAGMILGRTCHCVVADVIYPNFYIALVGRAGKAKKGTAMNRGIELVNAAAPEIPWLSSVDSAEGFVDFLSRHQKQNETKDAPGLLCFSELRTLIEKAKKEGSTIVPKLAEAFDCNDKIEVGTRHNPLRANRPMVSIFGGASPTWLDKLTMSDLEGGLGSRFLWIPSNPRKPYSDPPPKDQRKWNTVVKTLAEARKYWEEKRTAGKSTEFTFTPAAKEIWTDWFDNRLWNLLCADPLIEVMGERMDMHCRKIAMVYSAIERSEPLIDVIHLKRAIVFTEFLIESLYGIFSDFGLSEIVKQEQLILSYIKNAGPSGIRQRYLQQLLHRMDAETFNRRLRWLTGDEGKVVSEKIGRSIYLRMNQ